MGKNKIQTRQDSNLGPSALQYSVLTNITPLDQVMNEEQNCYFLHKISFFRLIRLSRGSIYNKHFLIQYQKLGSLYFVRFLYPRTFPGIIYTVRHLNFHKLQHKIDQPIGTLQKSVIRQKNGNFVSFQNMCGFKMSSL